MTKRQTNEWDQVCHAMAHKKHQYLVLEELKLKSLISISFFTKMLHSRCNIILRCCTPITTT